MGQLLLFIVVALVVAAIVFGATVMVSGGDPGLTPVEPDGRALPLPSDRPLGEDDIFRTRFDTAFRGYRMAQVDQALQRAAYDVGYKGELIGVLEAEVAALREGRTADADILRKAREAAVAPPPATLATPAPADETPGMITVSATPAFVPAAGDLPVVPPADDVPAATDTKTAPVKEAPVKTAMVKDAPAKAATGAVATEAPEDEDKAAKAEAATPEGESGAATGDSEPAERR